MIPKPKKVSVSKLKKKAWDMFSKYIRMKYANKSGMEECYTCGRVLYWKNMQAGHGIAGRNNAILFCEDVVRPQCVGCNFFGGGKYGVFMNKLIKEYGAEEFSQLVMMSTMTLQRKSKDYIEIYETYSKKLKELVLYR